MPTPTQCIVSLHTVVQHTVVQHTAAQSTAVLRCAELRRAHKLAIAHAQAAVQAAVPDATLSWELLVLILSLGQIAGFESRGSLAVEFVI